MARLAATIEPQVPEWLNTAANPQASYNEWMADPETVAAADVHGNLITLATLIHEHHDHVPAEATSRNPRTRRTAVGPLTTSATLRLLVRDRSWRVSSAARAEQLRRQRWRYVRSLD